MTESKKKIISANLSLDAIKILDDFSQKKGIRSRSMAIELIIKNGGKEKNNGPFSEIIISALRTFEVNYKKIYADYSTLARRNPEKIDQDMKATFSAMNATSRELLSTLKKWENKV